MSFFHKKVNHSVVLSILLIAGNQVDAEATRDEDYIGSPKITSEIPEDLRCEEGWVDVGYDISNTGEIVNVRILRSDPAGMFDQYALETFKKLKYHLRRAKPKDLKGVAIDSPIPPEILVNKWGKTKSNRQPPTVTRPILKLVTLKILNTKWIRL